jgi:RNA recognition motif-containing protein
MSISVYVANLPYQTTESDLQHLFEQYGEVTRCQIITDRETGQSRGFGFVEFADESCGQRAIDSMSGYELNGRKLVVNKAKPRSQHARR